MKARFCLTAAFAAAIACGSVGATAQEQPAAPASAPTTEATRSIAMRFLQRMFNDHDPTGAYATFAAPDMIQHNPNIADGLAGHRAYFTALQKRVGKTAAWANVNNMILVDGDLFALHHHAFTGPDDTGRVFVDIWRVANGRIAEHWDVIQPIPAKMAHDNGMGCGKGDSYAAAKALGDTIARPTCGVPDPNASREQSLAALDAYSNALRAGDVQGAIERFIADDYRQHSPDIHDGKAGALAFLLDEFGKGPAAMPKMGPMRIVADGNYVLMHRLTTYADGLRTANVDIFRLRQGQIDAHWDVKQPVPATSANDNGMW